MYKGKKSPRYKLRALRLPDTLTLEDTHTGTCITVYPLDFMSNKQITSNLSPWDLKMIGYLVYHASEQVSNR